MLPLPVPERQHSGRSAEPHWRTFNHSPAIGSDLNRTPVFIGKIEIESAGMLSDANTDRALGGIKLCARLKQVECRPDRRRARGSPGRLVVAAPQPSPETLAANGPSFSMALCYEIRECDPTGSMKQRLAERRIPKHIGRR